ncbi:methionine ABC transporter ATP-binding protein [Sphingobacterium corticibacter]|uniref:Cell division ATP-binding protein FtsE n=1 Tax=Sphingobacterium corticibacter TaxID=2171749 RepID=A0A2T8HN02_9SPHI|nr:ATP-binding cassette domain-containing protein [Sphingobacterium corticibacter]PVH26806.1 methionine ABC transporter ATP-binding protein [Sphingobacterium corticibacter]
MINVKHISKIYTTSKGRQVQALDDVSFSVKKGEIFGIIGSSGAGKSTILRCLNLLERPDQGEIWLADKQLTSLSERQLQQERQHIGMIFQHFNLLSSRTVFDNIALPLELSQTSKKDIQARVSELLELVGLADKANDYPSNLSGGQKQRVAIARALANNPTLLLCDEATSALDPATTKSILNLLQTINAKLQITIVLITHEIHVVKAICDRVAVVKDGKIVELGDRSQIFGAPEHAHTASFVASAVQADLPIAYQQHIQAEKATDTDDLLIRIQAKDNTDYAFTALQQQFGLQVAIIEARIETIGALKISSSILRLSGDQLEAAISFCSTYYFNTEILGYVSRSY